MILLTPSILLSGKQYCKEISIDESVYRVLHVKIGRKLISIKKVQCREQSIDRGAKLSGNRHRI